VLDFFFFFFFAAMMPRFRCHAVAFRLLSIDTLIDAADAAMPPLFCR